MEDKLQQHRLLRIVLEAACGHGFARRTVGRRSWSGPAASVAPAYRRPVGRPVADARGRP
ncbi:hypothetical protein ACFH04_13370 [Streptomyces noboritoensis]|uniref:Uncharacterized protein n=1 Tax=Streptomyces noboritoensis TaxID=67337 RepID=A0ABV6TFW7_9ACTN